MTLKLDQYIANLVNKEAKISHFDCELYCGKSSRLKKATKEEITAEYGQSFCEDADYMIFFSGGMAVEEDAVEKLFGIVNRALGQSANTLSKSDFKAIKADDQVAYLFVKITLN